MITAIVFNLTLAKMSQIKKIAIQTASLEDVQNGLLIDIFPLTRNNNMLIGTDFGMIVFIHNSSFRPTSSDGVFLKAGVSNYISVKRTFLRNPPKPYTDCTDLTSYSSELFDFI